MARVLADASRGYGGDMSRKTEHLSDELHAYLLDHSTRLDQVQEALIEETATLGGVARMQIAPEQGRSWSCWPENPERPVRGRGRARSPATRQCPSLAVWPTAAGCCVATSARSGRISQSGTGRGRRQRSDRAADRSGPGDAAVAAAGSGDRPGVRGRGQGRVHRLLGGARTPDAAGWRTAYWTTCLPVAGWSSPRPTTIWPATSRRSTTTPPRIRGSTWSWPLRSPGL